MALKKDIELENGIILTYHRITSLNKITNITNRIEVSSYVNKIQREKEKEYQEMQQRNVNGEELTEEEQELLDKGINVFINTNYINIPYDEDMTIIDAYEYLKTTGIFENSEDILEI